jgi:AraC-like DNA-binding protein
VWRRVCPAGQRLDLLHARVTEPFAPHLHEEYAVGACTAGREVIRYRGTLHYAGPGSVVVLEPGEAHTGGPADPPGFTYRVMYPGAGLLSEGAGRAPRFREPIIDDPVLAAELRSLHAALGEIATEAGLSRYQLVRCFRAEVGMPPYAWLAQHRVARARTLLEKGCRPAEAAALTGFADQAHLTRWFRRVVGVTPGAYRNSVQDSSPRHR